MIMSKPKVGIFGLTCCDGCELQILNIHEDILDVVKAVEITNFKLGQEKNTDDYDIAIIEGSVTTPAELEEIKKIREKAKIVVALGTCACWGGVQGMNFFNKDRDKAKDVYGDSKFPEVLDSMPLDKYIKVDCYIRGCPINPAEFVRVVKDLLLDKSPKMPNQPVCVECKLRENSCLFLQGKVCMGPVTYSGCGALCPSLNRACEGCYGPMEDANVEPQMTLLKEYGLTKEDLFRKFRKYASMSKLYMEKASEEKIKATKEFGMGRSDLSKRFSKYPDRIKPVLERRL